MIDDPMPTAEPPDDEPDEEELEEPFVEPAPEEENPWTVDPGPSRTVDPWTTDPGHYVSNS